MVRLINARLLERGKRKFTSKTERKCRGGKPTQKLMNIGNISCTGKGKRVKWYL